MGQPNWHRDHARSWPEYVEADEAGQTRLQQELRVRIDRVLGSLVGGRGEWESDNAALPVGSLRCTVASRSLELWLHPDGVSICRTEPGGKRRCREYEEWEGRTPQEFMDKVEADLASALNATE
jgi:hypothetical protein